MNRCWKCGQKFATLPDAGGLPPVRSEPMPAAAAVSAAPALVLAAKPPSQRMGTGKAATLATTTPATMPTAAAAYSGQLGFAAGSYRLEVGMAGKRLYVLSFECQKSRQLMTETLVRAASARSENQPRDAHCTLDARRPPGAR